MNRALIAVMTLGLAASVSTASAQSTADTASATKNRLSIGLGQGTADGYAPTTVGAATYLAPTTAPETNVNVEFWRSLSNDYALALSGAYGFSSMNWKGAASGDPEIDATGTSLKFRIGADRVRVAGNGGCHSSISSRCRCRLSRSMRCQGRIDPIATRH